MLDRDDANRNGRIEASEYSGSQRSFARFDSDESGALTEDELGVRLVPRPTAAAPTTRSAARAEAVQADALSTLKLRQAALLLLQVDENDDDVRTLTRAEFQRGWAAHDRNRDTALTLEELTAEPVGVRRRLTGKAAEAFARLLFTAIDEDRNELASAAEGLRWYDKHGAGVRNEALTIDALDDDRSAIARGAYDELSTSAEPVQPLRERLALASDDEPTSATRPVRNEEPTRTTPTAARSTPDRVAVAKEQTRERDDSAARTSTAQRGERVTETTPAPRVESAPVRRSTVVATTRPTPRSSEPDDATAIVARDQAARPAAATISGRRTTNTEADQSASRTERSAAEQKPVATRSKAGAERTTPRPKPKSAKKAGGRKNEKKANSETKSPPRNDEASTPRAKEPELPGVQDKRTNDKGSKKKKASRDGKKGKAKSKR